LTLERVSRHFHHRSIVSQYTILLEYSTTMVRCGILLLISIAVYATISKAQRLTLTQMEEKILFAHLNSSEHLEKFYQKLLLSNGVASAEDMQDAIDDREMSRATIEKEVKHQREKEVSTLCFFSVFDRSNKCVKH
jgi:uncharacterized metal-binding protein